MKSLSHLRLCNPMDCSLPDSSIHEIFQARVLEWVAISFSRRSYQPRDWTWVSHIAGRCFTLWTTRKAWPSNSTFRFIPKIIETICSHENLYMDAHSSQKAIQMFINWWMDKQNVIYSYNGVLFRHLKEWNTDTCFNTDEPRKHYSKWEKSDRKGCMLYDSIYIRCPE